MSVDPAAPPDRRETVAVFALPAACPSDSSDQARTSASNKQALKRRRRVSLIATSCFDSCRNRRRCFDMLALTPPESFNEGEVSGNDENSERRCDQHSKEHTRAHHVLRARSSA